MGNKEQSISETNAAQSANTHTENTAKHCAFKRRNTHSNSEAVVSNKTCPPPSGFSSHLTPEEA